MEVFGLRPALIKLANDTTLNWIISWDLKMILKNKQTYETLNIEYCKFLELFKKEIQDTFESYRQTQLKKYSYTFQDDSSIEYNFYFELQWNFNHFGTNP